MISFTKSLMNVMMFPIIRERTLNRTRIIIIYELISIWVRYREIRGLGLPTKVQRTRILKLNYGIINIR